MRSLLGFVLIAGTLAFLVYHGTLTRRLPALPPTVGDTARPDADESDAPLPFSASPRESDGQGSIDPAEAQAAPSERTEGDESAPKDVGQTGDAGPDAPKFVVAEIAGLSPTGEDVMLKAEGHKKPYLLMRIPSLTGASIATGLSHETPVRPFAHDVLIESLTRTGAKVVGVDVTDMRDGIFIAVLRMEKGGETFDLDTRPSDALAVAARVGVPLRISVHVLDSSGIAPDELGAPPHPGERVPEGIIKGSTKDM